MPVMMSSVLVNPPVNLDFSILWSIAGKTTIRPSPLRLANNWRKAENRLELPPCLLRRSRFRWPGPTPWSPSGFLAKFGSPTEPQEQGWPEILAGRTTLISAPTGSGKTLSAFLICIDRLVRKALQGDLLDRTEVLYVSPLKALGNDIQKNLEGPLSEILALAAERGMLMPEIRTAVRTGDTLAKERREMLKRPPHISGDYAGVALHLAHCRKEPSHSAGRADGDRGRNSCRRRRQAWLPFVAVTGTSRSTGRTTHAHWVVGDTEGPSKSSRTS